MIHRFSTWLNQHPGKAGALAGWYQQFASGIITLAMIPLITHRLSPGNAGVWFSFQNLMLIVSLADFGIGFAVARQVAFSIHTQGGPASGDFVTTRPGWAGVSELYAAVRLILFRLIVIELIVLVMLHELLLPLGRIGQERTVSSSIAWYLLGSSAMILTRSKQYNAVFDGLGKMYLSRFFAGTQQLLAGMAAITGILIIPNLAVMASGVFVVSSLHLGFMRYLLHREAAGRLEPIRRPPAGLAKSLVRVAAPMGIVNSSAYFVSAIQVPVIGSMLGPALVTPFYAAQKIGQMLSAAIMQMVTPQMPLFTREIAANDLPRAAARMTRTIMRVSGIVIAVYLVYFFGSPIFARWWLGSRSYVDKTTLLILSIDYALMCCSVIWAQFVLASGRNPFMRSTVAAGLLNLMGCFVLGGLFGVPGIAASSLLAGLLTNYWFAPFEGARVLSAVQSNRSR